MTRLKPILKDNGNRKKAWRPFKKRNLLRWKKLSKKTQKSLILAALLFIAVLAAGTSYYFRAGGTDSATAPEPEPQVESLVPEDAQALIDAKNYKDALEMMKPVFTSNPENLELVSLRAWLNFKLERYEKVAEYAQAGLELDPASGINQALIGGTHYQAARFEQAVKTSLKAVEMDPNVAFSYITLGNVYMREGKHQDGLAVFKKAARLEPKNPDVWSKLGSVYIKLKNYKKAKLACEAGLEIDPDHPGAHFNMAQVYFRMENSDRALDHIQKAEDMYRARENVNWVAKSRHSKRMIIKHFKLRPEDMNR